MIGQRCEHGFETRRHRAFASPGYLCWLDRTRPALGRRLFPNFFKRSSGEDGAIVLVNIPLRVFKCVFVFDE